MKQNVIYQQPDFVESIIAAVLAKNLDTAIMRPDYSRPINSDNLFRTTLYLAPVKEQVSDKSAKKGQAPVISSDMNLSGDASFIEREVHISNLLGKLDDTDEDVVIVVFQTNKKQKNAFAGTLTRHYLSKKAFDEKMIKVGYLNIANIENDINDFLQNGKQPA